MHAVFHRPVQVLFQMNSFTSAIDILPIFCNFDCLFCNVYEMMARISEMGKGVTYRTVRGGGWANSFRWHDVLQVVVVTLVAAAAAVDDGRSRVCAFRISSRQSGKIHLRVRFFTIAWNVAVNLLVTSCFLSKASWEGRMMILYGT